MNSVSYLNAKFVVFFSFCSAICRVPGELFSATLVNFRVCAAEFSAAKASCFYKTLGRSIHNFLLTPLTKGWQNKNNNQ